MISQVKNTQLVVTFLNDKLFFIEVEQSPENRLSAAGEVRLSIPFNADSVTSPQAISRYAESLNHLIDRFAITATSATFILDQRLALIRRLKIDRELKSTELNEHINWEMEQFCISPRKEFHINYERVTNQRDHFDCLIVAAVRKQLINFIIEIFKHTPLTLTVLDIYLLAGIRGLFALEYVEASSGFSVVIAFEEPRIQIILLKEKAFVKSAEIDADKPNDLFSYGGHQAETLATLISDQIHLLLDSLGDEVLLKNITALYLLNGKEHVNVVASLQKLQRTAKVHFIEPLKNIKHSLSIEEESIISSNPMCFLALLGALQR